jgi:hypothetical protein
MSAKSKMMQEIAAKAERMKALKKESHNKHTVQAYVFDFFKRIDEIRLVSQNRDDKFVTSLLAHEALRNQLRTIDYGCNPHIEWSNEEDNPYVRGVRIEWSKSLPNC